MGPGGDAQAAKHAAAFRDPYLTNRRHRRERSWTCR